MKYYICNFLGFFLMSLSWVFALVIAVSRSWHVWEFNSSSVRFMYVGFWEAFYYERVNISGVIKESPRHQRIHGTWVIPNELEYGRDLILLAIFGKTATLRFPSPSHQLHPGAIPRAYHNLLQNICVCFHCLVCFGCSLSALIRIFSIKFYGESPFDFPINFPVRKEGQIKKHSSYVLPLGIMTATLSLGSAMSFIWQMCLSERQDCVASECNAVS